MTQFQNQQRQTISLERVIAAPPERLFAAWTDPLLLVKWWGPPGSIVRAVDVDLKIGGKYRIGIEQPDGNIYFVFGIYEEINPPNKLSFTWRWEQPEMDIGTSRVTIQLTAHENGTYLRLLHAELPNQEAIVAHEEGWVGILQNLSQYIAS